VITVRPTDLVFDVLKNSFEMEGIPIDEQILIYKGNKSDTIESWGLTNGSTLDLLLPPTKTVRAGEDYTLAGLGLLLKDFIHGKKECLEVSKMLATLTERTIQM
jgi:hypothetical protein